MEESSMGSLRESMVEYRKQLGKGYIKDAYRGLMEYIANLRLHLANKYPDYFVSGSINYGFMDYTYFYFFPKSLKKRNLKIVLLFIHDTSTFEIWLAGYNKSVQTQYWEMFKESDWTKYPLAPTAKGIDYIIKHTLADNADFGDLDALTKQLEHGTLNFTKEVEAFLSKH
jgi:hypothetical protein